MAELPNWFNRAVLSIENRALSADVLVADLRVRFQSHVFIDNQTGYEYLKIAEVAVPHFQFDAAALQAFAEAAREWLNLPIDRLGSQFFTGQWDLGTGPIHRLSLVLDRHPSTPSKTDWFLMGIHIAVDDFNWDSSLHVDYTCLKGFVDGLFEEGFVSPED